MTRLNLIASTPTLRFSSTRAERDSATQKYEGGLPGARIVLSQQKENENLDRHSSLHSLKTIVWDSEISGFSLRTERFWQYNSDKERKGILVSELPYRTSCLTPEGYFLDQEGQRIILPNGNWIDGPTGKLYTCQGVLISQNADQRRLEKEV